MASVIHQPRGRVRRPPPPPAGEDAAEQRPAPRHGSRLTWLGVALAIVFAALFLRLWALQVLAGPKYVGQAQAQSVSTLRVQAPRGMIVDRKGRPLVTNEQAYEVQVWPAYLPKVYPAYHAELSRLARATGVPLRLIAAQIKARNLSGDLITPVNVSETASRPLVTYLSEHESEFRGVTLLATYVRHYPYHALAAQVLGYVGQISQLQLDARAKSGGYAPGDVVGQAGLEATYDGYLRGVAGAARLHVDARGRPVSAVELTTPAKPGHSLQVTLDVKLQQAAEKALQYGIGLARANGQWAAHGGAIVAMDPNDGSILALASSPGYEPSVFTGRVTEQALGRQGLTAQTAERMNYPSLNRAIQAMYPPGSVFKPVTALAALQEKMLAPYAYLPCKGTYTAPEDRSHRTFHNWDPNVNQPMDLPTALAYSCDTYFYQLGNDFYLLPANRGQPLQKWARSFGFGSTTGSDLGAEVPGLVPTIGWRRQQYTPKTDPGQWQVDSLWKPGNSIQLAIGQGDLLVTPLQMARFYSLLANGGKLVTPHLLEDVQNPNGTVVPVPPFPAPRSVGIDPAALRVVRQGLWEGTHLSFGTSVAVFGKFPVSIAGKTGTAEKVVSLPGYLGTQNQSWWCGYGPTQRAKLVVCAVIENGGHGGTAAAPAAARVFSAFFNARLTQVGPIHSD
ncbi:MAG: penicillin-binding protein 2 [Gaiellaceae bacterium]